MKEPKFGPFVARVVGTAEASPTLEVNSPLRDVRFTAPPDTFIWFRKTVFERVDFSGCRFDHLSISGSTFIDCDFSRSRWAAFNAGFDTRWPSRMIRCRFDRASLKEFRVSTSRFEACSFRNAKVKGWRAWCAEFVDCTFTGPIEDVIFSGRPDSCYESLDQVRESTREVRAWYGEDPDEAVKEAPRRARNEFVGNDFSEAEITGCDWRYGIDMTQQRWPSGRGYELLDRWPERIAVVRSAVDKWPPSDERERTLYLLRVYSSGGEEEQEHHLLTPDFASGWYARDGVGERLRSMLEGA